MGFFVWISQVKIERGNVLSFLDRYELRFYVTEYLSIHPFVHSHSELPNKKIVCICGLHLCTHERCLETDFKFFKKECPDCLCRNRQGILIFFGPKLSGDARLCKLGCADSQFQLKQSNNRPNIFYAFPRKQKINSSLSRRSEGSAMHYCHLMVKKL